MAFKQIFVLFQGYSDVHGPLGETGSAGPQVGVAAGGGSEVLPLLKGEQDCGGGG